MENETQHIQPLISNVSHEDVKFEGEQTIKPLFQPEEPKKLEIPADTVEYVDIQCNKVVAFIINWIKTTFASDIIKYLQRDYKEQIKQEILTELKK